MCIHYAGYKHSVVQKKKTYELGGGLSWLFLSMYF